MLDVAQAYKSDHIHCRKNDSLFKSLFADINLSFEINEYILINGINEPLKTATQIKVENQQQYIIQQKINLLEKKLENNIPKQKVKDIAKQIQEEYNKVQEQFDCIWNKKSKDNYDRYKLQELSAMQQELGFILGKIEKLLEEGE